MKNARSCVLDRDVAKAVELLTKKGIHFGIKWRDRALLVEFKGGCANPESLPMTRAGRMYRTGLALENLMRETGTDSAKEAVYNLLGEDVFIREIKPPQPLKDEMGRRAEPSPAIANPIALLIQFL